MKSEFQRLMQHTQVNAINLKPYPISFFDLGKLAVVSISYQPRFNDRIPPPNPTS